MYEFFFYDCKKKDVPETRCVQTLNLGELLSSVEYASSIIYYFIIIEFVSFSDCKFITDDVLTH